MKFSIVIPTYNGRALLPRTLPSVLTQDWPAEDYEVILVVDGSNDGTLELLQAPEFARVQVIAQANGGPAAARDAGVARAQGELLLFLDDDIVCTPRLLRTHAGAHAAHPGGFVHGRLRIAPDSPRLLMYGLQERWYEEFYGPATNSWGVLPPRVLGLVNSSVARETFTRICAGARVPFPREEFELALRMYKAGVRFEHEPAALAYEFYVKTARQFAAGQGRAIGRAELALCEKHPDFRKFCALSRLGEGKPLLREIKNGLIRHLPIATLLGAATRLTEGARGFPGMRRLGEKLLPIELSLQVRRSAAREAGGWNELQRRFGMRLPVLMYHHVGPRYEDTYPELTVEPKRFRRQIDSLLRSGCTFIRPEQWRDWVDRGMALPDKPALLTFDDAYADLAQYVFPFLVERNIPAVVFVPTAAIGRANAWDDLPGAGSLKVLSAEEIRDWHARGIEFGAHCRTHPHLRDLSPALVREEIEGSRRDLEAIVGGPVTTFAYPYGEFNAEIAAIAREKFAAAFTVLPGVNVLLTDPAMMVRTPVWPHDGPLALWFRVRYGYEPLEWVRGALLRRIRGVRRTGREAGLQPGSETTSSSRH